MKSTMTKERMEQILADAPKAINGKNFRFEQRTANYTDERGFPRSDTFTACPKCSNKQAYVKPVIRVLSDGRIRTMVAALVAEYDRIGRAETAQALQEQGQALAELPYLTAIELLAEIAYFIPERVS